MYVHSETVTRESQTAALYLMNTDEMYCTEQEEGANLMAGDMQHILSSTVAWYHRASNLMRFPTCPVCGATLSSRRSLVRRRRDEPRAAVEGVT